MPKNTSGGKKFKKLKHAMEFQRPLDLPDEEQEFALVNKLMGNGRATVTFVKDNSQTINALGIISGKLRKRKQWVIAGNFVIISMRSFETDKVDIIHVYKEHEMNELKRKGLINSELIKISNSGGSSKKNDYRDDEFAEFVEDDLEQPLFNNDKRNKSNQPRGNNISVQDFGIPSDSSEESDEE